MADSFVLNTGARIPAIGLGTAKTEPGTIGEAVYAAVKVIYWNLHLVLTEHIFRAITAGSSVD
jgi:hypothetical protein